MSSPPGDDVSDSDDEWYSRMEAEGAKYDDNLGAPDEHPPVPAPSSGGQQTCTEEEYFNQIQQQNCAEREGGFASELDPIWHSMLQSVAKSTNKTGADGLVQLTPADSSSLFLLQQWVTGYLPKSCKQLMEIVLFSNCVDDNRMLFTDDVLHPSMVCIVYVKPLVQRVEVSLFSPYCQHEINFRALLSTIRRIQRAAKLKDVVYCGTDGALFETGIVPRGSEKWSVQWVENCGHYVNEEVLGSGSSIHQGVLPEGYGVCDLRPEDAQQINDSWKYKSATSLDLVRTMIDLQLCSGITHSTDTGAEGRLVSWFLTYPDASMGMLFTTQVHRGKGLARAVVQAVLGKCVQRHHQESRRCAPYVYIESSNDASRALFTSLGFRKCNDVVWAGLTLKKSDS